MVTRVIRLTTFFELEFDMQPTLQFFNSSINSSLVSLAIGIPYLGGMEGIEPVIHAVTVRDSSR